jgi:hypothetical protein
MKTETVLPIIKKAQEINAQNDQVDIDRGLLPTCKLPVTRQLRLALHAIYCGLLTNNMGNIAEGYVMLQDLEEILYNLDKSKNNGAH